MTLQLNRPAEPIKMRNYGRIVQDTIAYATTLEPGVERDSLEIYIAQCMRQRNLVRRPDLPASARISSVSRTANCVANQPLLCK